MSREALVERVFAGMAKRRVADVVKQGQGFHEVFIESQSATDRTGDRRDLMGVRQPRAVIIAHITRENLHLPAQAAKRRRVHDPIAVPLKRPAIRMLRLVVLATARIGAVHSVFFQ